MVRYQVETITICQGWVNCWSEDDKPLTFDSFDQAVQEKKDHIINCINAVEGGEMEDSPDPTDLRIMPIIDDLAARLALGDALEVHGCIDYGTHTQQEPDDIAHFWSVYVHLKTGGLDCLADFETRTEAEAWALTLGLPI